MANKFLQEIFEQPQVLENTLNYYLNGQGEEKLEKVSSFWKQGNYNQILFTGMGSSFFAPHVASCMLSSYRISSCIINSGELIHYHFPLIKEGLLLTCISQSGESYEIVKILENLKNGIKCLGITNEENSSLARKSALTLFTRAGKEEMTSTKTYVSTLLVLNILARTIGVRWNPESIKGIKDSIKAVDSLIMTRNEWIPSAIDFLDHPSFVQIIGRGPSYSSVLQGALMVMEAAKKPSAGILGGEFRHGPMEMVKKGFRAIILAPVGATYNQGIRLASDISGAGGRVVLITNSRDNYNNPDIFPIRIPCQDEYLFPIPAIIPLQFIVNQWAIDSGQEPGEFSLGAKVTITE